MSAQALRTKELNALTFSQFYIQHNIDYLKIQEKVSEKILKTTETDRSFNFKFTSFMMLRAELATKFRGRSLSNEELREASAHGMSLYITHGTLLRKIYLGKNLIVINHDTTNLQNFYLCNFVEGYEGLINSPKFPLGVLSKKLY